MADLSTAKIGPMSFLRDTSRDRPKPASGGKLRPPQRPDAKMSPEPEAGEEQEQQLDTTA